MIDHKASTWEMAVRWLLEQPGMGELVRGGYYDSPLLDAANRYWCSQEWQAIRGWLPLNRGRALDAGSGRGIGAFALAKEGFSVTALEPDPSALVGADAIRALSVEAGLPINVVQGVSETIPFKDGEFDVLFARAALHHALDLDSTCEELFRVLKPGGRIIVVREHVISRASDLDSFLRAHPLHDRYGGENAYLLKRYVSALKNAGFRIRRVIAPLESAINLAPHTMGDVQNELAIRCGRMIPGSVLVATLLLGTPGLRWVVRQAIGWFDDRPGRLYSFVADRP